MYGYIQHNYYKGHIFLEGEFSIIVTKYSIKKKNFQGEKKSKYLLSGNEGNYIRGKI